MFVRWKTRKLAGEDGISPEKISLYAVLVENHRIEGKTRQKVVRYLGYINESQIGDPAHQHRFWEQVDSNMRGLSLTSAEQIALEAKITARVAKPTGIQLITGIHSEARAPRYAVQQ
jgi:hypothetical protein